MQYLFTQVNVIYSPSGSAETFSTYFASPAASEEEYLKLSRAKFQSLVANPDRRSYTEDTQDAYFEYLDNEGFYPPDDGSRIWAHDGEAKIVQHIDEIECLCPLTEELYDFLQSLTII